ncbi:MAG: aconitate hydratase [Gemmatimonadetes bacterium]|nr:aconitate hydratase [Gemmatimonadota bacterium]
MGMNLAQKLIASHLRYGDMKVGEEIGITIDQVLTPDATGVLAYLQFESMELPRVRVKTAVAYADHVVYSFDEKNSADHLYLRDVAHKHGAWYSQPGNGICHQVHRERFAVPGETLLGSDSHTPTAGGLGMLAMGAGGLDVAVALGGGPYFFTMPQVVRVHLTGELQPWVSAKDIILEMLRRETVKGGIDVIYEYVGPGAGALSAPQRCTIANMGTELGATTSVFASDERTRDYLRRHAREHEWREVGPDADAAYDRDIDMDLSALEPLVACPSMPDRVVPVREMGHVEVQQVMVGSCTNGSYTDLLMVAKALQGRRVSSRVHMIVAPASRSAVEQLAREGYVADMLAAGVNLSEATCGACIGFGHVPAPGTVSLRTYNRNFASRSGLKKDAVYLASPAVAVATAIHGRLTDPRTLGEAPEIDLPVAYATSDAGLLPPAAAPETVTVYKGDHMSAVPPQKPLEDGIEGSVILKTGDDITTDDIIPAGTEMLSNWANLPITATFVFQRIDPTFHVRAQAAGSGWIVGGFNYGQGSSREHAAMAPMYLGIKGVVAKSFARIHKANLINFGLLPLTFEDTADYESIEQGDQIAVGGVLQGLETGRIAGVNVTKGTPLRLEIALTPREREILLDGGLLAHTRRTGIDLRAEDGGIAATAAGEVFAVR